MDWVATKSGGEGFGMKASVYECDMCQVVKKETNHWFLGYAGAGVLLIEAWDDHVAGQGDYKHLCGDRCVHKFVQSAIPSRVTPAMRCEPADGSGLVIPNRTPVGRQPSGLNRC